MSDTIFDWKRGPRADFILDNARGVYALFLIEGSKLPKLASAERGLIYIGMAGGQKGFKQRCHFDKAQTRNHSPRKSLAVLLMRELELVPELVNKPNSSNTWGLERESDIRLTQWMHKNLEIAYRVHDQPDLLETELVSRYAPPLNLSKCSQNEFHRYISNERSKVQAMLECKTDARLR